MKKYPTTALHPLALMLLMTLIVCACLCLPLVQLTAQSLSTSKAKAKSKQSSNHVATPYNIHNLTVKKATKADNTFRYKKLQLYPIIANEVFADAHQHIGEYTSLNDALAANKVRIEPIMAVHDTPTKEDEQLDLLQSVDTDRNTDNESELSPQRYGAAASSLHNVGNFYKTSLIDNTPPKLPASIMTIFDNALFHPSIQEEAHTKTTEDILLNTLGEILLHNVSDDTLYLMTGEVIKGCNYDQVIARDFLVMPHETDVVIPVFYVEEGHWVYKKDAYASSNDHFYVHSLPLRKTLYQTNGVNTDIWSVIERINGRQNKATPNDVYTELIEHEVFRETLEGYLTYFLNRFNQRKKVVGVVAVSGNQILGVDIFATHELFLRQYQGVVFAYITEAITQGDTPTVNYEQVLAYFHNFLNDKSSKELMVKNGQKNHYLLEVRNTILHKAGF